MLLLLLFVVQLADVQGLDCYQCLDVRNVSDCHNVVTCPADNLCSTETSGTGDQLRFNLTCKLKQNCLATTTTPITGSHTSDCSACCAKLACNKYLCSAGTQSITNTTQCKDDPTFGCQRISTLFNICGDVQHAKVVCRDFCGLCDLVDGGWSDWSQWSECDVTCGNGTIYRSRTCTNPSPAHGGTDCSGANKQTSSCSLQVCPISGGWSAWSPWGSCSMSCSVGLQRRDRSCSNPYPVRFGDHCFGDDKVYKVCFERSCDDGAWSSWSAWGTCSATCNGGLQPRTRTCTNPAPTQFGMQCQGTDLDKQICNTINCPEKEVAFSVHSPNAALTSDGTPTFTHTILNVGGGYNATTGKFTCPTSGIYSFSVTIRHDNTDTGNPRCWYRVNGVTQTYVGAWEDAYDQASGTMVVKLVVGDVVDLACYSWEYASHDNTGTTFSGVLITPS